MEFSGWIDFGPGTIDGFEHCHPLRVPTQVKLLSRLPIGSVCSVLSLSRLNLRLIIIWMEVEKFAHLLSGILFIH